MQSTHTDMRCFGLVNASIMQCAVPRRSQEALLPNCKALKVSSNKVSTAVLFMEALWLSRTTKMNPWHCLDWWDSGWLRGDQSRRETWTQARTSTFPVLRWTFLAALALLSRTFQDLPDYTESCFSQLAFHFAWALWPPTARSCNSSGNQLWTTSSSRRYLCFSPPCLSGLFFFAIDMGRGHWATLLGSCLSESPFRESDLAKLSHFNPLALFALRAQFLWQHVQSKSKPADDIHRMGFEDPWWRRHGLVFYSSSCLPTIFFHLPFGAVTFVSFWENIIRSALGEWRVHWVIPDLGLCTCHFCDISKANRRRASGERRWLLWQRAWKRSGMRSDRNHVCSFEVYSCIELGPPWVCIKHLYNFKLSNECHHFGSSWELTRKGSHHFVFPNLPDPKSRPPVESPA